MKNLLDENSGGNDLEKSKTKGTNQNINNIVVYKLYDIKKFLDNIKPDQNGSYKQSNAKKMLQDLLCIKNILCTIISEYLINQHSENIDSDDITDGPRPEYLKLISLQNGIEIMAHKMYFDNILEYVKKDNEIKNDEDDTCTPIEQNYSRYFQKQINKIINSKVTQT